MSDFINLHAPDPIHVRLYNPPRPRSDHDPEKLRLSSRRCRRPCSAASPSPSPTPIPRTSPAELGSDPGGSAAGRRAGSGGRWRGGGRSPSSFPPSRFSSTRPPRSGRSRRRPPSIRLWRMRLCRGRSRRGTSTGSVRGLGSSMASGNVRELFFFCIF